MKKIKLNDLHKNKSRLKIYFSVISFNENKFQKIPLNKYAVSLSYEKNCSADIGSGQFPFILWSENLEKYKFSPGPSRPKIYLQTSILHLY